MRKAEISILPFQLIHVLCYLGAYYSYDSSFPYTTFSACGTSTVLNIGTSIKASNSQNSKGSGYIATDDTKVKLTQVLYFP